MKFIELKNIQKEDLKKTAKKLRELKKLRKPSYNKQTIPLYVIAQQIDDQKYQFRHKHIAYCQFFNNTEYEDIENYCIIDPIQHKIDDYINDWKENVDLVVENV